MRALAILAALLVAPLAGGAAAQSVLTVDQERLFLETRMGARTLAEIEEETQALAAENRRLEAELISEERALTQRRAEMTPQAFAEVAAEFDTRVQRLRAEQDAKVREIARAQDEARAAFFNDVRDILRRFLDERGADVILDRRAVFVATESADVTDAAIARINAALGDGDPGDLVPEVAPAPAEDGPRAPTGDLSTAPLDLEIRGDPE